MQQLRREHYPAERNQVPAHLTLFHHLPPEVGPELGRRLAEATARARPKAAIAGIIDLDGGTALRIDSDDLAAIREELAGAFHGLLTPLDQTQWWPHVTIQNKVEAKEARALQRRLAAGFTSRPLAIRGLAAWRYRDGPWDPVREWRFRR